MHQNDKKEWLVRTRSGDVIGPFTERELLSALKQRLFAAEDEIAKSCEVWISAMSLSWREDEEFTLTHTRTHQGTESFTGETPVTAPDFAIVSGGAASALAREREELPPPQKSHPWFQVSVAVGLVTLVWAVVVRMTVPTQIPGDARTSAPQTTDEMTVLLDRAGILLKKASYPEAISLLSEYRKNNPQNAETEYLVPYATALILQGQERGTAKKLLETVLQDPHAPIERKARAHHWMGYLMLGERDSDMGENHFLEALQLNPKDPASRFNLGCAYLRQKKSSQALDYLQLAELEVPNLWLVHIYKGRAKKALGMNDEAKVAFKRAVDASPDRWISYLYYAVFLKAGHDTAEAQKILRQMLTRDPGYEQNSPAPLGFFEERVPMNDYLETFEEIMPKGEERELGRLYLGFLIKGAQSAEAKRLEAVEGNSLIAKVLALKVALEKDTPAEGLRSKLSQIGGDLKAFGAHAYLIRAEANLRLAQYAEAQQDIQSALHLEPQSPEARWALVGLLQRQQRANEVREAVRQLLAIDPEFLPALRLNL